MNYYAHSKENESKEQWQTLKDHLSETAKRAKQFAEGFNASEIAYYTGLMHDLGKYSLKFQKRLEGSSVKVDHSTAGGKEALSRYGEVIGGLMAYCIVGHHTGLANYGSLNQEGSLVSRLNNNIEDYSAYVSDFLDKELAKQVCFPKLKPISDKNAFFSISFFTRMLFSCLKDADYLDTEKYMIEEEALKRSGHSTIKLLCNQLSLHLNRFKDSKGEINKNRSEILKQCIHMAHNKRGLYSLSVPTGGGKTLSSLAFGLKHSLKNDMCRIIYAIPYTSIIEQNADIFRSIFGECDVLEHHSNYIFEDKELDENNQNLVQRMKFASENWDIPIVATTNVQFFESLFSNKSSKTRKLHNIVNSVIILDEAQMIPTEFLKPCILALCELVINYRCTIVLCTATQPYLKKFIPDTVKLTEIMSSPLELYEAFKRVEVQNIGKLCDNDLSALLLDEDKVLCIVNTRKHAKKLFTKIKNELGTYHLSTLMCPVHRSNVLSEIKERLKSNKSCRVISTQLIEAGVDIDFPIVYRSSAGLDSIAQSAGRCNREGKLDKGLVNVFFTTEKYGQVKGFLARTAQIGEMTMNTHKDDILSPEAIKAYFKQLYTLEGDDALDKHKIIEDLNDRDLKFNFAEAARKFNFIDSSNSHAIVIPYDQKAKNLIEDAKNSFYPASFARKLRPYTITIYNNEFQALEKTGAVKTINEAFVVLNDLDRYNSEEGLILPEGSEVLII